MKKFQVGDYVKAKVKKINFEPVKLQFTLQMEALTNHAEYLKKNQIFERYELAKDNTFIIIREEDYPVVQVEGKATLSRFKNRKINHPHFKNIGLGVAISYLQEKPDGNFVFRPSSKGTDYLNLTWKFYGDVIVHLTIKEGYKSQQESISKELQLNGIIYSSMDDIIENYVKPCNLHV